MSYAAQQWTGRDPNRKLPIVVLYYRCRQRLLWPQWRVRRALREFYGV